MKKMNIPKAGIRKVNMPTVNIMRKANTTKTTGITRKADTAKKADIMRPAANTMRTVNTTKMTGTMKTVSMQKESTPTKSMPTENTGKTHMKRADMRRKVPMVSCLRMKSPVRT